MATEPSSPSGPVPAAIKVHDLRTTVGERVLHDGLFLTVDRGEAVAIAGDNGSGKTTLLRCLLGLRRIERGEVSLLGAQPPYPRAHLRSVGALVGDPPTLPWMRPRAFLEMLLHTAGEPADGRADAALDDVGLPADRRRTRLGKLSQGECRLVGVASAVMRTPRVLVLDEPFAHLDREHVAGVEALIDAVRGRDGAVLFTTHRRTEAERATRLVVLDDAQLTETVVSSSLAGAVLR